MQTATLCFPIRRLPAPAVLLGLKRRGFGQQKFTGFGGKVERGEPVVAAAVRELAEEARIHTTPAALAPIGQIRFHFPAQPAWGQSVWLFLVEQWRGLPASSTEMTPVWFPFDGLPYQRMWDDAAHWLPKALQGAQFTATITFAADNETVREVVFHVETNLDASPTSFSSFAESAAA